MSQQWLGHVAQAAGSGSVELALMARFATQQQLLWFAESAPYEAVLAGDARVPASAVLVATCELLPANRQQQRAPPLQVTDE